MKESKTCNKKLKRVGASGCWQMRQLSLLSAPGEEESGFSESAKLLMEEKYWEGVIRVYFLNWREKYW